MTSISKGTLIPEIQAEGTIALWRIYDSIHLRPQTEVELSRLMDEASSGTLMSHKKISCYMDESIPGKGRKH